MGRVRGIQRRYEKYAHQVYEETSLKKIPMESGDVHREMGRVEWINLA